MNIVRNIVNEEQGKWQVKNNGEFEGLTKDEIANIWAKTGLPGSAWHDQSISPSKRKKLVETALEQLEEEDVIVAIAPTNLTDVNNRYKFKLRRANNADV